MLPPFGQHILCLKDLGERERGGGREKQGEKEVRVQNEHYAWNEPATKVLGIGRRHAESWCMQRVGACIDNAYVC